jgi:hypothetical protein
MDILPLQFLNGHVFVELDGDRWLLDTGAVKSFSTSPRGLTIDGEEVKVERTRSYLDPSAPTGRRYLNLSAATLSQSVGVACAGLLGVDVLNRFDHIFDAADGKLTVSTTELSHGDQTVPLDEWRGDRIASTMGIPIVTARVKRSDYRMFFDTGAQISYFPAMLGTAEFPSAGIVTDFHPRAGQLQTYAHWVPVSLGGVTLILRCATLFDYNILMADSTVGIIGNEILWNRTVGYFPRRRIMVL